MEIIGKYKIVIRGSEKHNPRIPGLKQAFEYKRILSLALFISKVAKEEDADLIVYPSEGTWGVIACFLASRFCSKPWTAIIQPGASLNQPNLFQPSYKLGPLNPLNILAHVHNRTQAHNISTISKIGFSIDFLSLLNAAKTTIMLTVSSSVVEDFSYLDPRVKIIPIVPGNGIDLSEFEHISPGHINYEGVFFGRMLPEKGFFDLVEIWKLVVRKIPKAKLAVCGIAEDPEVLKEFLKEIGNQNLSNNIEFLGQQDRAHLMDFVMRSYLTINPSYVDGFSLVTLESLACGTPVVAYNLPASRHNFGKCKAVFRIPVGDRTKMADTIHYVLTQTNRKTLTEEAMKSVTSYDWNNIVKAERDTYALVINRKRGLRQISP